MVLNLPFVQPHQIAEHYRTLLLCLYFQIARVFMTFLLLGILAWICFHFFSELGRHRAYWLPFRRSGGRSTDSLTWAPLASAG